MNHNTCYNNNNNKHIHIFTPTVAGEKSEVAPETGRAPTEHQKCEGSGGAFFGEHRRRAANSMAVCRGEKKELLDMMSGCRKSEVAPETGRAPTEQQKCEEPGCAFYENAAAGVPTRWRCAGVYSRSY